MELIQLKYFKTVASMGKLSDAAQALFVSAPALSTSISRLEKELRFSLFDHTKNRITLNPQGHIFLKYKIKSSPAWNVPSQSFGKVFPCKGCMCPSPF